MPGRAVGNQRESTVADALDKIGYYVVSVKGSGSRGAKMRRRVHSVIGDLLAFPGAIREYRTLLDGPRFGAFQVERGVYTIRWDLNPWLQIEVGAHSAASAFKALRAHPMPGFTPIAVLYVYRLTKGKVRAKKAIPRWYVDEHTWFPSASEAIDAIRDR